MFNSIGSIVGFLLGLALTVGLLLTRHLVPGGYGFQLGLSWSPFQIAAAFAVGLGILSLILWLAGRMVRGAQTWKEPRVILAAIMIAFIANTLYMFLVELFDLNPGWRALVAVLGVPVIYGNLAAVLGRTSLHSAMVNIFTGALTTMGAGFIIAAMIRGW